MNARARRVGSSFTSIPKVFIVESLDFDDEEQQRFEGQFISDILRLSGSGSRYVYIRTETELEEIFDQFEDSRYRYLHFSCHGSKNAIGLTLNTLNFTAFARHITPVIDERRVFFSSCEVMNEQLAGKLLAKTECYSVIGPSRPIGFDRAAIFWAAFYHMMLRDEARSMTQENIRQSISTLRRAFGVHIRYFSKSAEAPGYKEIDTLRTVFTE